VDEHPRWNVVGWVAKQLQDLRRTVDAVHVGGGESPTLRGVILGDA
jgi:hypothetical protein